MLLLVRHGETVWNAAGRYQGAKDSPLTARGRGQAAAVGRLLARLLAGSPGPIRADVSPLGRTRETATIIAAHLPLAVRPEPRIAELSIGTWDWLTEFEIAQEYPGALAGTDMFDWFFRSPDGERLDAAVARISHWLADDRPIVAISHGLAGRVIRGVHLGLDRQEMLRLPVPQDGIHILTEGRAVFVPAADGQSRS